MGQASRWAGLITALWAGVLLCIGLIAAPAAFAVLPRHEAGLVAARLFATEAYVSLALIALLFVIERQRARSDASAGKGSVLSTNTLLLLSALFCTVAGSFAIPPMMEAARAGQGAWSFGALHAASAALFALKGLLVLALAWRLGFNPAPTS